MTSSRAKDIRNNEYVLANDSFLTKYEKILHMMLFHFMTAILIGLLQATVDNGPLGIASGLEET